MSILIKRPRADEAADHAMGFISGIHAGEIKWSDISHYNHTGWKADGFVYFAVIGYPYVSHVKVGFTKTDPERRIRSLQTGCPFPILLLGYVFGSVDREQELHDVFKDWRVCGEWFEYSEYVANEIERQMAQEPTGE